MLNEDEIAKEEAKFFEEVEKRQKNLIPVLEMDSMDVDVDDNSLNVSKPEYRTTHSTGKVKQINLGKKNDNALF